MKIRGLLKWVYGIFFVLLAGMLFMVLLLYTNQLQIEEHLGALAKQDPDLSQASDYIKEIILLFVFLVLLLSGLFIMLNRRISRPIAALLRQTNQVKKDLNRLTEATIEISQGQLLSDYTAEAMPLHFPRKDEFNELAQAQNEMLSNLNETGSAISLITAAIKASRDKLQDVNTWLEAAVNERTLDLKNANEQLEKAHKELQSLDKAKSDFLRMVSHEIRTPLNGIQGFTYLMKDMPQAPEVAEVFDLLEVSVKRLERFSLVALRITELEAGNKDVRREAISPGELILPVLKKLEAKIQQKNLQVITEGDIESYAIRGDKRMLPMCVESILDNAVTYSNPGGMIRILSSQDQDSVNLEFKDQGPGFSAEALKNLFKTFSPGEEHIDENVGLDLALAKMIMDAHAGKIEVGNNPEGGACVSLIFRT